MDKPLRIFRVEYNSIDATMGGIFGGRTDMEQRVVPGVRSFYIDGQLVSQQEFERAHQEHMREQGGGHG